MSQEWLVSIENAEHAHMGVFFATVPIHPSNKCCGGVSGIGIIANTETLYTE